MGEIVFKNICKSFGDVEVIKNLNLSLRDGEFTVLVGASGCGKTTALRMIAGIGPATSGELFIDGKNIVDVPPGKRDIAMVFQNYAIYPTMTVRGNIEFGLKNKKVPKAERDRLIAEVCEVVGLTPYLSRKPSELSGGQRQRVALARAMVKKPSVFLMDEPLSNLDAKLRATMRTELIELHHKLGATFVYVTHDQAEAMSMADTIILMDGGRIMQQGSPEVIYNDPDNVFTAQFIGIPPMNIFEAGKGFAGYRPEKAVMRRDRDPNESYCRTARIVTREMMGSETLYKVDIEDPGAPENGAAVMVKSPDGSFGVDDRIYLSVKKTDLYFFDENQQRIRAEEREKFDRMLSLLSGGNIHG